MSSYIQQNTMLINPTSTFPTPQGAPLRQGTSSSNSLQPNQYYLPSYYEKRNEFLLNKQSDSSNKSSTLSTVKETPFNQPCQISSDLDQIQVSQIIKSSQFNNPEHKDNQDNMFKIQTPYYSNPVQYQHPITSTHTINQGIRPDFSFQQNNFSSISGNSKLIPNGSHGIEQNMNPNNPQKEPSITQAIQGDQQSIEISQSNQQRLPNNSQNNFKRLSSSSLKYDTYYPPTSNYINEIIAPYVSTNYKNETLIKNVEEISQEERMRLIFKSHKQNLENQIFCLELRLKEVTQIRIKYFENIIKDIKREKEREVNEIEAMITMNKWNPDIDMKGIESLKRKIRDIGFEIDDLKDIQNYQTRCMPSLYYNANRASRQFGNNLRRSNSASKMTAFIRSKPSNLPEIAEQEHTPKIMTQIKEKLPINRIPYSDNKEFKTSNFLNSNVQQPEESIKKSKVQSNNDILLQGQNILIDTPKSCTQIGALTPSNQLLEQYTLSTPANPRTNSNSNFNFADRGLISSDNSSQIQKSVGSPTPYNIYADNKLLNQYCGQNKTDQEYIINAKKDNEFNIEQYKIIYHKNNQHQRTQSLGYNNQLPFLVNNNLNFNQKPTLNNQQQFLNNSSNYFGIPTESSKLISSREMNEKNSRRDIFEDKKNNSNEHEGKNLQNNQEVPSYSNKQNSTHKGDNINLGEYQMQGEEQTKMANQRDTFCQINSNDDDLENSASSNRVQQCFQTNQKRKSSESHQSSRYSSCNEDEEEEKQKNTLNNIQVLLNQEPKIIIDQKYNSAHKIESKNNNFNKFYSNQKCDKSVQSDQLLNYPSNTTASLKANNLSEPYQQLTPKQVNHFEGLQEGNFYNNSQGIHDSSNQKNNFEKLISSVKICSNEDLQQQQYHPDQRFDTARFDCNEILSRQGQNSEIELNIQSNSNLNQQIERQKMSSKQNESFQTQSQDGISLEQNTPSQVNRDFDSFSNENYQNISDSKHSQKLYGNQKDSQQLHNESRDLSNQDQDMQKIHCYKYEYQPEPLKEVNSFVSSQNRQDTQSVSMLDQEASLILNNQIHQNQNLIEQSHNTVNQGECSYFSEKDQSISISLKKFAPQKNQREQQEIQNQLLKQENLHVIEEYQQKSDDSQCDSQIVDQQRNNIYQNQNIPNNTSNILGVTNNNNTESMIMYSNINKSIRENNFTDNNDSCSYMNMNSPRINEDQSNISNNNNNILSQLPPGFTQPHKQNFFNSHYTGTGIQQYQSNPFKHNSNMQTIDERIERQLQSSQSSEVQQSAQINELLNQSSKIKGKNNSERSLNDSNLSTGKLKSDQQYLNPLMMKRSQVESVDQQNKSYTSNQKDKSKRKDSNPSEPQFFLGHIKARIFLSEREYREFLVNKNQRVDQQKTKINQKQQSLQRDEESKFAKCDLVYLFNSQYLQLLFTTSLLYSSEENQAVIDQFTVQSINPDQIDIVTCTSNQVFLKIPHKNEPSINNKVVLIQNNCIDNYENDFHAQKISLEDLKKKILLICQLRNNQEELTSLLFQCSQPLNQSLKQSDAQRMLISDVKESQDEWEETMEEESKIDDKLMQQNYLPASERLSSHSQMKMECSNNNYRILGDDDREQEKMKKLGQTPQFNNEDQEIMNNYNQNLEEQMKDFQKISKDREQQNIVKNSIKINEQNDRHDYSPQKENTPGINNQNNYEVQIFSGYSNPNSNEKKNGSHLNEIFQENQNQFSTIKREHYDEEEEVQELMSNQSNINEFKGVNYLNDDFQENYEQNEFTSSQYEEFRNRQKQLLQSKYRVAQYNTRTPEEEAQLAILKKFDEKKFIMKKYGQNSTGGQMRRIFFSSDFRFFCWKGVDTPELKRIIPLNQFQNYIINGRNTENFKRFKTNKQEEINCSFSLVLDNRTIDLMATSVQEKEEFIQGLQIIFKAFL